MSRTIKIIIIASFTGLASGLFSSVFLYLLRIVNELRENTPLLIWGLPIFGLFLGLTIRAIPHHINQGIPYILQEFSNKKAHVSIWMTPFILISSVGTHFFGGSAGREGVGVIMGASISHLLPKFHSSFQRMREFLIYAGISAGVSSIFGTPLAGILFAFELRKWREIKRFDLFICSTIASYVGLIVPHWLGPGHQTFPEVSLGLDLTLIYSVVLAGVACGFAGQLFYWGLKSYTALLARLFHHAHTKLFFGGLLITLVVVFTGSHEYGGLGTKILAHSFSTEMSFYDFTMKWLLTVLTLAPGFKGGEVTPLFVMGAAFCNKVLALFHLQNFPLSSALGMVGLFGAVSATPFASAMMGAELFGPKIGIFCLATCLIARKLMMGLSIYRH